MGHWYSIDGKPCHTQKCKPGAKSAERPTDIRDARKLGLLPSVSGILEVMANDGLVNWKIEQVIEACHGHPPMGDDVATYSAQVRERAFRQVGNAADLGTKIHAALESYFTDAPFLAEDVVVLTNHSITMGELIEPVISAVESLNIMPLAHEKVLVNPRYGYAGTSDLIWESVSGEKGILDFKSKKTVAGKPVFQPDSHVMQLAAYWQAEFGPAVDFDVPAYAAAYNVVISTTEIGRVEVIKHEDTALREAWDAFKACLALWQYKNNYKPNAA